MLHFFFFFISFQLPWAHLFNKHYWALMLQALVWVLLGLYWWMRYDTCPEQMTSKAGKLPKFFGAVLPGPDPTFLLFHVLHPSCVIFFFVPLLYLVYISIITFFTLYCVYLIMSLAPGNSWEAEAMPYSYSYSKCHNGSYKDFIKFVEYELNPSIPVASTTVYMIITLNVYVHPWSPSQASNSLFPIVY